MTPRIKEKAYLFSSQILVDLLKEHLRLSEGEIEALQEIVNDSSIDPFLRKISRSWDNVMHNIFLISVFIKEFHELRSKDKRVAIDIITDLRTTFFKDITREETRNFLYSIQNITSKSPQALNLAEKFLSANYRIIITPAKWRELRKLLNKVGQRYYRKMR